MTLVAELDKRRAFVIPVKPEAGSAPVNRVDQRKDIIECRRLCNGQRPGDTTDPVRARRPSAAQCIRDICQPAYVDALIKTYFQADVAAVMSQLSTSTGADLESLLAISHNQALLAEIDQQATLLAQRHALARSRLDQQRQRELEASQRLRAAEIAAGRAARRARVKAAADAFGTEAHGQPPIAPAGTGRPGGSSDREHGIHGDHDAVDCATDPSCAAPTRPSSITCVTEADDPTVQATGPASHHPVEPSTPIGCTDQRDCPSGQWCDVATGTCCVETVR